MVIYYGVPRKSVAQVWQKDLLRFLPKGQGDIKCQHVYSSLFQISEILQIIRMIGIDFGIDFDDDFGTGCGLVLDV